MKYLWSRYLWVFMVLVVGVVTVNYAQQSVEAETVSAPSEAGLSDAQASLDPTVLKDKAMRVMETYCVSCHGPDKQKGKVRLDALETIDPVDQQELFARSKEVVHFEEMPPAKAKQPTDEERKVLMQWLKTQVSGEAAKALAEKLLRFEYGNVVDHDDLFSGEHADLPGYTPDRRWLVSEYIFNEKVNRLLDYQPTRTIYGEQHPVRGDSGIHWSVKTEWGNKFRRTITNPFLLPKAVGVRYSAHQPITAGHLLTMLGNAKRISGHMASEDTMKANYPAMLALMKSEFEDRETLRSREAFLTTYSYMDRLLADIYGDKNEGLLPKLVRKELEYPGPFIKKDGTNYKRQTNLGLLGRMDGQDIKAIYRAIAAYETGNFEVKEIAPQDGSLYQTYATPTRDAYSQIILKAERDWVMEGVSDYRITNRISIMKLLYDQWDLAAVYRHVKNGDYQVPAMKPLDDTEMQVIVSTIKKNREKGDTYLEIIDKCMANWRASFKAERDAAAGASDEQLGDVVIELYRRIFEREPTAAELGEKITLAKSYLSQLDSQSAIKKLIESLLLDTEFVYRHEFGTGDADEHGRRMMSPRDASYALAYALTDSSPDDLLVKAAVEGRLNTPEDYEREVRRMLARRDIWTIIDESVQAANLNASVTNQPIRKLRFFRDFFGYPKAMEVFKDDARFGAGVHRGAVSRLVDEADLWVEHILEKDKDVFEEFLTTDKFYVYHNGNNEMMAVTAKAMKDTYEYFKDLDWENFDIEDISAHAEFLTTQSTKEMKEYQPGNEKSAKKTLGQLKRFMKTAAVQYSDGQSMGVPYMFWPYGFWAGGHTLGRTGQQMRGHNVTTYWNIDWRTWDYPTEQPAKIPNRKGILTHPAWLIAHAQNLETDPIHRGKWVREKLLAGTIPDVPITVDAVIPEDHTKTMRQRMENRTGDAYCWRCHQKMDPLGFPFESYDDFGRFRTEENLEHADNLIKPVPVHNAPIEELTYGAHLPVYKTLPVDPRGVLKGTDDSTLDGEVDNAFEMIDRLAESDKVRQSIIRHAFRYFMGRNETLSDSKTLKDAEKAYLDSNGSFDEVIVSLLTSDSFIYRAPKTTTKD